MPRVYNPADRPLVIDDKGRTIAGRDWADVDIDSVVSQHLSSGRLIQVDTPSTPEPAPTPESEPEPELDEADDKPVTPRKRRPAEES